MNMEKEIVRIKRVSIDVNGVHYKLENTAFPDRYISHEMIIEMFYKHRGSEVAALNELTPQKEME